MVKLSKSVSRSVGVMAVFLAVIPLLLVVHSFVLNPPPRIMIGSVNEMPSNSWKLFWYPNDQDASHMGKLIRLSSGEFKAYNRVDIEIGCLLQYNPRSEMITDACHGNIYDPKDGKVVGGPALAARKGWALPMISLEIDSAGNIWATGIVGEIGVGRPVGQFLSP